MYAAPLIYDNLAVTEPCTISMYKMKPIYDHLSATESPCSGDLDARQDKCISDLEQLMSRVHKLQTSVPSRNGEDVSLCDLEMRQDKCLEDLKMLMNRVEKLQAECCSPKPSASSKKLDLAIGCSVGSPAVYATAIMARKVNCLIKVFSHSSNKKDVDSSVTEKLQKVNRNDSDYCGINMIYKDVAAPYFMASPGRQIPVSGLSNILRFIARHQGYSSLYDETQLESAALIDEILSLIDSLEQRISGSTSSDMGQLLNQIAEYIKSTPYLGSQSLSIADIGLCSCLAAMDPTAIPNSLKAYLSDCVKANYELKVLKAFVPGLTKQ